MPTIRDDSAGPYGTWNNDDLSWLDYLTAKASDGGNALANLGRNLVDGFSPIGTSEQGNMALQVPPIVSGIAQSYSNLAGSPSHPGNAYELTGVPELDAPIQQDMSNVLLSLYGGNAVSGLARGGAKAAANVMPAWERPPIPEGGVRAYRGAMKPDAIFNGPKDVMWASSSPMVADSYAGAWEGIDNWMPSMGAVAPLEMNFKNPMVLNAEGQWSHSIPFEGSTAHADKIAEAARQRGHDGLVLNNVRDGAGGTADYIRGTSYAALAPDTVYSPLTGQRLLSDTGKPSILGSAMAGAGDRRINADWDGEFGGFTAYAPNGKAAAYADVLNRGDGLEISNITSFPEYRGQGYARSIVDRVMSEADGSPVRVSPMTDDGRGFFANNYRLGDDGTLSLISDNRPSLLGSALATAGQNYELPPWLQF